MLSFMHVSRERSPDLDPAALLALVLARGSVFFDSAVDVINFVDSATRPLVAGEPNEWQLPPERAFLASLIATSRGAGCELQHITNQLIQDHLAIDPREEWEQALQSIAVDGLRNYSASVAVFQSDPNAYGLQPVSTFPPPHGFKSACDSQIKWRQTYARVDATLEMHDQSYPVVVDGFLVRNRYQLAELRTGQQFLQSVASVDDFACALHNNIGSTQFEEATAIAVEIVHTVRPWDRQAARHQLRQLTGTHAGPLSPIGNLAWSFIAEPITWQPPSPRVENGQHRLCLAHTLGVTGIVAVVPTASSG